MQTNKLELLLLMAENRGNSMLIDIFSSSDLILRSIKTIQVILVKIHNFCVIISLKLLSINNN